MAGNEIEALNLLNKVSEQNSSFPACVKNSFMIYFVICIPYCTVCVCMYIHYMYCILHTYIQYMYVQYLVFVLCLLSVSVCIF